MSKTDTKPDSGQQLEAIWAELRQLLDWHQGFGFYLVFGEDARVTRELRQRIDDYIRFRARPLRMVRPSSPSQALTDVLQAVLPAEADEVAQNLHSTVWIELTAEPDNPAWQQARRQVLAALNQRRSALEQQFQGSLLMHLPVAFGPELVTWAPDLWSIRRYVAVMPAWAASEPDHDSLQASKGIYTQYALTAQTRLIDGQPELALSALRKAVDDLRRRRIDFGDTPQTLRDLSISLERVGNVEGELGRSESALAAYQESLSLRRQLRSTLGDTPQTLRDLSISLDNVGNVERELGRSESALAAYQESLSLRRQLRSTLGDTPQTLRDLSVSLDNVGNVEGELGRSETALAAYQESLSHARLLYQQFGPSHMNRSFLLTLLPKVAEAEASLGETLHAEALKAELAALQQR